MQEHRHWLTGLTVSELDGQTIIHLSLLDIMEEEEEDKCYDKHLHHLHRMKDF